MKKVFKGFLACAFISMIIFSIPDSRLFHVRAESDFVRITQKAIAPGVSYQEEWHSNYIGSGKMQNINIVQADLSNPDIKLVTTKANNVVISQESIPNQARREIADGRNIVAGITGDMSSVVTGIPMGLQIKDGNLIINHNLSGQEILFPSLAVDSSNHVFMGAVHSDGKLSIGGNTIIINSLNRNEYLTDKIALYTPVINMNSTVTWYVEGSNPKFFQNGCYLVVEKVNNPSQIKGGIAYTGKIKSVIASTSANDSIKLESDCVLIAAFGNKKSLISGLVAGADISFQFDTYVGKTKRNDIVQAISGYNWLIKDNKVLTPSDMKAMGYDSAKVDSINAETGVGLTADNKLIFLTVDKSGPDYTKSTGIALGTLAQAMSDLGVINAIGMDSGGSTEMYIKQPGDNDISVANHPSDGRSRGLTNAFSIVNTATDLNSIGKVFIKDTNIKMLTGATHIFKAAATDTNYNYADITEKTINWYSSGGTMTSQGEYTAPEIAGAYIITAAIDGIQAMLTIEVVENIDSLAFTAGNGISLKKGASQQLDVYASLGFDDIIINPAALTWSVSDSSIGSILDGVFTANSNVPDASECTITISGNNNISASILVYVSLKNVIIDDFENIQSTNYTARHTYVNSFTATVTNEKAYNKNGSLKFQFDYSGWTNSSYFAGMPVLWENYSTNPLCLTNVHPKSIGVYIYSDGSNYVPWMKVYLVDGAGKSQSPNLCTKDVNGEMTSGNLTWTGWKYFESSISESWPLPLKFEGLYAVDTDKTKIGTSFGNTVYFDLLQYKYEENPIDANYDCSSVSNDFSESGNNTGNSKTIGKIWLICAILALATAVFVSVILKFRRPKKTT